MHADAAIMSVFVSVVTLPKELVTEINWWLAVTGDSGDMASSGVLPTCVVQPTGLVSSLLHRVMALASEFTLALAATFLPFSS